MTFVDSDGSGITETIEQTYGDDYVFPQWAQGTAVFWYAEDGEPLVLKRVDKVVHDTVYARWDVETRTVSFETNGGGSVEQCVIPVGTKMDPNHLFPPVKENAVFLGWYYDSACEEAYDPTQSITSDLTLHARWAEGGIRISLSPNEITSSGSTP